MGHAFTNLAPGVNLLTFNRVGHACLHTQSVFSPALFKYNRVREAFALLFTPLLALVSKPRRVLPSAQISLALHLLATKTAFCRFWLHVNHAG